jgi:hypothetical protein
MVVEVLADTHLAESDLKANLSQGGKKSHLATNLTSHP